VTADRRSAAIVGLGLIGGSLARDLAARGIRVLGFDNDPATLSAATAAGVVPLDATLAGVDEADVVIVATPVSAIGSVLGTIAPMIGRASLVTDVGSTKRSANAAAAALGGGIGERFVGSHPMAGDHRTGWSAARRDLFAGADVYLCPTETTSAQTLERARGFWSELEARPRIITAEEHDALMARASHLPHVASAAIALALETAGVNVSQLGSGGRDVVRIAGGSADLWADIAIENGDELLRALAGVPGELERFREALAARDRDQLRALFARARQWVNPDARA
jgi:prephenate dehydrogenase